MVVAAAAAGSVGRLETVIPVKKKARPFVSGLFSWCGVLGGLCFGDHGRARHVDLDSLRGVRYTIIGEAATSAAAREEPWASRSSTSGMWPW